MAGKWACTHRRWARDLIRCAVHDKERRGELCVARLYLREGENIISGLSTRRTREARTLRPRKPLSTSLPIRHCARQAAQGVGVSRRASRDTVPAAAAAVAAPCLDVAFRNQLVRVVRSQHRGVAAQERRLHRRHERRVWQAGGEQRAKRRHHVQHRRPLHVHSRRHQHHATVARRRAQASVRGHQAATGKEVAVRQRGARALKQPPHPSEQPAMKSGGTVGAYEATTEAPKASTSASSSSNVSTL